MINDTPLANAQAVTMPEDTPLAITLTGSDGDGLRLKRDGHRYRLTNRDAIDWIKQLNGSVRPADAAQGELCHNSLS
jgi:hypothetical protein